MRLTLTLVLIGFSLPAKAWTGEPLCAFEPAPQLSLPLSLEVPEPAPMCMPVQQDPTRDLSPMSAAETWTAFRELSETDPEQALLRLALLEEAMPRLADVFALERGHLLLGLDRPAEARRAYASAFEVSSDSEILVRARVGRVRALLAMGHRDAVNELTVLERRYPDLPEEPLLELELAMMRERDGKVSDAVRTYRRLDIRHPGSAVASRARERLAALLEEGVAIRPLTPTQRVERAERLVRRGPLDDARTELAALMAQRNLSPTLRTRVYFLSARIARHEGRWDDARRLLQQGRNTGVVVGDEEDQQRRASRAEDLARAAVARERDQAEQRIRQLRAGRRINQIGTARVLLMGRVAARAELTDEVNAALEELVRRNLPPGLRLRSALELAGAGDDEHVLALLDGVYERPGTMGLTAAYHRARALQRLGRFAEAEIAFLDVQARDRGITPFYAMWSELQLGDVRAGMIGVCGPQATCGEAPTEASSKPSGDMPSPDMSERADTILADAAIHGDEQPREGLADEFAPTERPDPDLETALELLGPIVEAHGEAYPWFGRAQDFLRLGETDDAGRQLYEAFLAWREAAGRPIRRTGRESVARGDNRARRFLGFALKRDRRELDAEGRDALSRVGELIGDYGVSTGFGGWDKVAERPRAYSELVEAAAERHGLDPNLLFAIMRVESVYQKEIVSYAGAIGLCQIMPRTGQLIANALHRTEYTAADLLDPETNLDFAAWYLRSLIDRFDGRLPLAIASYNGGPHNVRQWMANQPEDMPLDTFLEHIPFDQTHRYVRRVLTHYQAYRAQQGLPMIALTTELPAVQTDTVAF